MLIYSTNLTREEDKGKCPDPWARGSEAVFPDLRGRGGGSASAQVLGLGSWRPVVPDIGRGRRRGGGSRGGEEEQGKGGRNKERGGERTERRRGGMTMDGQNTALLNCTTVIVSHTIFLPLLWQCPLRPGVRKSWRRKEERGSEEKNTRNYE